MRNKIRSIVSLFTVLCILLWVFPSLTAESEIVWQQTGHMTLTVSGSAFMGTLVTINVMPKGKGYADLKTADDPLDVIVYQNQTKASLRNKFSFDIGFKKAGEYIAYVKVGKKDVAQVDLLCADTYEAPPGEHILDADFEGKVAGDYGLLLASAENSISYEEHDSAHGTSLRMHTWKGSTLRTIFDKPFNKECIAISYSYLREDTSSLFYMRLANSAISDDEEILTDKSNVRQTFFSENGRVSIFADGRNWNRPADDSLYMAENIGGWNNVVVIVDYKHSEVTYSINGQCMQTVPVDWLFDLYGFGLVFNQGSVVWLDNIRVTELDDSDDVEESCVTSHLWEYLSRPFDVNFDSGKIGNIFTGEENLAFDVVYTERDGIADNLSVEYTVKDENGITCWTGTDNFYIGAKDSVVRTLKIPLDEFAVYRVNAVISSNSHTKYSVFTQFSKVNTPPAGYRNKNFGMNVHMRRNFDYDNIFYLSDLSGAGILRDELTWTYMISKVGDEYIFPEEDIAYWEEMRNQGFKFIFNLNAGMPDGVGDYGSDAYCAAYKEWATVMVNKLNEIGLDFAIETTNEWNHNDKYSAQQYVPVLKAGYEGVKAADPDVLVVGGCLSGVYAHQLKAIFDLLDGDKVMDVFSVHIYSNVPTNGPEKNLQASQSKLIREYLDKYGYTDVPVWLTETGWTSSTSFATERNQARFIARTAAIQSSGKWWETVVWYDLRNDGSESNENESNFGMVEFYLPTLEHPEPMAAKPAFLAYSNYNAMTYDAKYSETLSLGDDIYAYQYEKESGKKLIFVASDNNQEIALNVNSSYARVYDIYGNAQTRMVSNGELVLEVGPDPQYVEFGSTSNTITGENFVKSQYLVDFTDCENGFYSFWTESENENMLTGIGTYNTVLAPVSTNGTVLKKAIGGDKGIHKGEGVITVSFYKQESTGENHNMMIGVYTDKYNGESIVPVISQKTISNGFTHLGIGDAESPLWLANYRSASTSGAWKRYDIVIDLIEGMAEVYYDNKLSLSAPMDIESVYGICFEADNSNYGKQKFYFDNFGIYITPAVTVDACVRKDAADILDASVLNEGDLLTAYAHIENKTNYAKSYTLVYAVIQGDKLISTDYVSDYAMAGQVVDAEIDFELKSSQDISIKLMVLENIGSMKPYVRSFVVK